MREDMAESRSLNVNVGVLGHVDSGKTTLVAGLSTVLSTAALDKNPQSQERGITLDLGFSAFSVPLPEHLHGLPYDTLQFTLVDCPGHASLIKTIIGGSHIMDVMVLVIDITKGIQVQTAECLVVGEVTTQHMLVVLNKIDLLEEGRRERGIRKAKKQLSQTLQMTKFASCKVIPVSAKKGVVNDGDGESFSIGDVAAELVMMVKEPPDRREGHFLFAIDHCFQIKGHGAVITGTALQGSIKVNETLEIPTLKERRKVKSIQMFKKSVGKLSAGDRAGICIPGLDATRIERGLAGAPETIPTFDAAIAWIDKVRFYPGEIRSKSKFHIIVGHNAVMARITFFGAQGSREMDTQDAANLLFERLNGIALRTTPPDFDFSKEYKCQDCLYGMEDDGNPRFGHQFGLLEFDAPLTVPQDSIFIGAKLDSHLESSSCRLSLYGQFLSLFTSMGKEEKEKLRIFKWKRRLGVIERVSPDGVTAICKGMFKKETDLSAFIGMKVKSMSTGQTGTIEGSFGGGEKFRVSFEDGLSPGWDSNKEMELIFKRYIYDFKKAPTQ